MFLQNRSCWYLAIILLASLNLVAAIRINELELNPAGEDSGNEWIELYSQEQIDLSSYYLRNYDNQTENLSGVFSGYFVINLRGQWLDNSDEKVFLFSGLSLVDETDLFSDSYNDNRSWQYCDSGWELVANTRNSENSCQAQEDEDQTSDQDTILLTPKIDLLLVFDNPLEYQDEFEIRFKAFNLQDRYYDIKLWLEKDDKVVSEIFDEIDETWYSGNYYVNKAFDEPGNESQDFKIRLKKGYSNLSGELWIKARIKENNKDVILDYREETIKIKQKVGNSEIAPTLYPNTEQANSGEVSANNSQRVISLTKDIKSQEVWKSKLEYIKEYSIYGFTLFCIVALIVLILTKKGKK